MLISFLNRCRLLGSLLLFGLVSISIAAADEGGAPPQIKVLIVEGVTNHAWEKQLDIVRAILSKDGSFDADFTISPAAAGDPAWATTLWSFPATTTSAACPLGRRK